MNIISFKLPKKNAVSSNAMKMLHNPTVDRKNKVAENRLSENLHELEMIDLSSCDDLGKGRLLRGRVSFSSLTSSIVISGILFFL
jgi:hypothetical protein